MPSPLFLILYLSISPSPPSPGSDMNATHQRGKQEWSSMICEAEVELFIESFDVF